MIGHNCIKSILIGTSLIMGVYSSYGQFYGGNADGHAVIGLSNSTCAIPTINAFGGGVADGFSHVNIINNGCSIATLNAFSGGSSDGFSALQSTASCTPLPIELTLFEAKALHSTIIIFWKTAAEINNDYFILEKSNNGIDFFEVKKIKGAGNSNLELNYSFTDINPIKGISFYRLKQTDYDGQYVYSNVLRVLFNLNHDLDVMIYPNPTRYGHDFKVLFNQNICDIVRIEITDILGNGLYKTQAKSIPNAPLTINLPNYIKSGIYALTLSCEYYTTNKKLIVE